MHKFLIDTCVWLDIAKDSAKHPIIPVIEELVKMGRMSLLVPRCIIEEFERNRERVANESNLSLKSVMSRVRDTIDKLGENATKKIAIDQIDTVSFKLPFLGEKSADMLKRIDALLKGGEIIEVTDTIKLRAIQRALDKRAPFHRNRNSMNDAIIFETYATLLESTTRKTKFTFVTNNKLDFSQPAGNDNMPHSDFSDAFIKRRSTYSINLPQALYKINRTLIDDLMIETQDWSLWFEERSYSEIRAAEEELEQKIWYNRHQIRAGMIADGRLIIIERTKAKDQYSPKYILKDIWDGAKLSARKVEKKYGKKNLAWDDFEWGMLNGKLSALRWVMGNDWDYLDT